MAGATGTFDVLGDVAGIRRRKQAAADRAKLARIGHGVSEGALKFGAAAADIGTLPVRAGMGVLNTALRVPNAMGLDVPYIPEQAFGGSSASMTPYTDKLRAVNGPAADTLASAPSAVHATASVATQPTPAATARPSVAPIAPRTLSPVENAALHSDRGYGAGPNPAVLGAPPAFGQATTTPSNAANTGGGIIKVVDPTTGKVTYTDTATSPGAVGTPVENRVSTMSVAPGDGYAGRPSYDTSSVPAGIRPYGDASVLDAMSQPSALSSARQAAANRGDFGAVRDSYQKGGGTWQGTTAAQDTATKAEADALDRIKSAVTIPQAKIAADHYATLQTAKTAAAANAATINARSLEHLTPSGTAMAGIQANAPLRTAQTDLTRQQAASAKQAEADKKQANDIRQQMITETDPAKYKALERKLYTLGLKQQPKYQIVTEKGVAADGFTPTQTSHIVTEDTTGNPIAIPLVGPGARSSPYPEGTKLTGKDGKPYTVKNGVPVRD